MNSQLVTVTSTTTGGVTTNTATTADATITDALTSVVSLDSAVTGLLGLGQRVGLILVGMEINAVRLGKTWNPFAKAQF